MYARRVLLAALAALTVVGCGKDKPPPLVTLPQPTPQVVLIRNVAVLDVESGRVTRNRDVMLNGPRISAIVRAGQAEASPDALEIDGRGATLLPGLIDMHAHLGNASAPRWKGELPDPPRNMQAYLYSGVTTVFDTGAIPGMIFKLRRQVAAGELLGPRIFATGPIVTAKGGHPVAIIERLAPWWIQWYLIPRYTRQVDTADEARAAVQDIAELDADAVKVVVDRIPDPVPRISDAALEAVIEEARSRNLRTVAHIGSLEDAIVSADAGVAMWIHGVYKERIPDAEIARLARYRIPMIPTTVVFEGYALLGRGPRAPSALERETAPSDVLAAFDEPPQDENSDYFRPYLEALHTERPHWRDNVRRLHRAGVTILAGSDTQAGVFPGAGLHRELHLLHESGLTRAQAIRAATLDAARWLANGKEPEFGIVAPGKLADLLLVEGDPTRDLDALARIRAVIRNGVPLERHALK